MIHDEKGWGDSRREGGEVILTGRVSLIRDEGSGEMIRDEGRLGT